MNTNAEKVLRLITSRKIVSTRDIVAFLDVARQYASQLLNILVRQGKVIKIGSIRNARYTLPEFADEFGTRQSKLRLQNKGIEEHEVTENFLANFPAFRGASPLPRC